MKKSELFVPTGTIEVFEDGKNQPRINVRLDGETVWLTQLQMAELYQTRKLNISLHIQSIYRDR